MVLRVEPADGSACLGMFAAGGLGRLRAVVRCPSPKAVAVIVDALVYVVDVEQPQAGALIARDQLQQVVAMPEPPLLLFVRFSEIEALGPTGIAWCPPNGCARMTWLSWPSRRIPSLAPATTLGWVDLGESRSTRRAESRCDDA
jgi:hypothetical protein